MTMRSAVSVIFVLAVAAGGCGGKTAPVARPAPPPPSGTTNTGRPPTPPQPVAEPVIVPPEPVPTDTISSASLDDLNRNSPLQADRSSNTTAAKSSPPAQAVLTENAEPAARNTRPGPSRSKDTPTNAARPSTIWPWESVARSPRAPIWCRSAFRPNGSGPSATERNFRSTRDTTKPRTRRTGARISSSPQSENTVMSHGTRRVINVLSVLGMAAALAVAGRGAEQGTAPDDG